MRTFFTKISHSFSSPSALLAALLLVLPAVLFLLSRSSLSSSIFRDTGHYTVVLDAGHGGTDPGKVSASGVEEKDVNLDIALKCRSVLKQNGITVILTRDSDESLEDSSSAYKKASDLRNRKKIMTENQADCAVSIHQNSFPDPAQHGSQVFYHPSSEEGKKLASCIQNQTKSLLGQENRREIKSNGDYYLLRDNPVPTVIAEICFLSNPSEAEMITDESIQERAAFAIAMGIMQYLCS